MTFDEFLENKGMTPENTPGSEHDLACEAYKAGYEEGRKNAIVWHKADAGVSALEKNKEYMGLLKDGSIRSGAFWSTEDGYFFGGYDWEDIEAWAEMPGVRL